MLLPPMWAEGGSAEYPFGTDSLGRCILSQMIYGARVALFVGFCRRHRRDAARHHAGAARRLFRRLDRPRHQPFGRSVDVAAAGGAVADADGRLRHRRRQRDPVDRAGGLDAVLPRGAVRSDGGARARTSCRRRSCSGFGDLRIILREILPSVAPLVITLFTLQVGIGIIVEAILSFVGLSVPADVPAWGQMIAQRAQLHVPGAVGHHPADPGDVRHRARIQPARRRPAGRRSIRGCGGGASDGMSVLSFDNVTVTARMGGRSVDVLRDISFSLGAGRDRRPGRRIRRRQEHDRPGYLRPAAGQFRGQRGRCRRSTAANLLDARQGGSGARCSAAASPSSRRSR